MHELYDVTIVILCFFCDVHCDTIMLRKPTNAHFSN